MTFPEIEAALLALADSRNRVDTDAATPEQVDLAAAILQLAKHAPATGMRIHARQMTNQDWQQVATRYLAVAEQAARQTRTVESSPDIRDHGV
ncbi:hypothetical protein LWC34_02110 [Kibdelosporangium philippinense]|uniref:Uncharacterized protein n=1 Tax=Kibdelosporangium philippinense TaxID=211113 RepID=A0ABS8Z1C0_9PSEU|nr:hypothetical protein [Kibdelosporangium philippinense]MCE7001640.1 hypothetical protein [Kibdelosporangium philippinense]